MKTQGFFGVSGLLVVLLSASWAVTESHAQLTNFQRVYSFGSLELSGSYPLRIIESSDGRLYGVSWQGGVANMGTLFKLQKDGTQFQILKQFGGPGDGAYPVGVLTEGSDGWLYGTTSGGGGARRGTIFKMSKTGTGYQIINDF